jgi:lipoprotein-anchoring transpeptidase ErfK/SrfK
VSGPLRVLLGLVAAAMLAGATVSLLWRDQVRLELAAADGTTSTTTVAPPSTSTTTSTVPTSTAPTSTAPPPTAPPEEALPSSGSGKRVVFSIERQRMWWVDEQDRVLRTSLVSGRADTPEVGTFQVYSKTLNATGLDGSRMDYFVRFTKGPNGWAIGFHDIPRVDGVPVQTEEQLGQPLSHGCIRQRLEDAKFTWEFLDVGSTVVVVA